MSKNDAPEDRGKRGPDGRPTGRRARREYAARQKVEAEIRREIMETERWTALMAASADALAAPDPLERTMAQIAQEAGLPPAIASQVFQRMKAKGLLLSRAVGQVTREETKGLYEHLSHKVLSAITDTDIEQASLYQKVTAAAIMTDKGLLLGGQPTQIFSIKQLDNLDALGAMLVGELERRQLTARTVEIPDRVEPATDEELPGQTVVERPLGDELPTQGRETPQSKMERRGLETEIPDVTPGPLA